GIQGVEEFARAEHQAFAGTAPSWPVDQSPKGWSALRLEAPQFRSGFRVDGDDVAPRRWGEHYAVHNNGIALDIVAAISRVVGPNDLEIRHVLAVDLVQRRESRTAIVTM